MVTIKSAPLKSVEIRRNSIDGKVTMSGTYALINDKSVEIASQTFGGYLDSAFTPSPRTVELMLSYYDSLSHDVSEFVGTN